MPTRLRPRVRFIIYVTASAVCVGSLCPCLTLLLLVVLGLRASNGLSALSCVSAVVMHIVAVCLRMNKVDYYYYYLPTFLCAANCCN